jgi:hypothetical protein
MRRLLGSSDEDLIWRKTFYKDNNFYKADISIKKKKKIDAHQDASHVDMT